MVGWFVSLLVREKVLLTGLCERKILFQLKIYDLLRQAIAKRTGCSSLSASRSSGDSSSSTAKPRVLLPLQLALAKFRIMQKRRSCQALHQTAPANDVPQRAGSLITFTCMRVLVLELGVCLVRLQHCSGSAAGSGATPNDAGCRSASSVE